MKGLKDCNKQLHENKHVMLWRSVVVRALVDLTSKRKSERQEAAAWFNTRDENFKMVCELAQIDMVRIIERARELIQGQKKLPKIFKRHMGVRRAKKHIDRNFTMSDKKLG